MADNSRWISDEELRKELTQLEQKFNPSTWTGHVEDVNQAYIDLAETFETSFPRELKVALVDYEQGQLDARTRHIVEGLNKLMPKLRPDHQWGTQQAINQAKSAAARELATDPEYSQQKEEYSQALTIINERRLDMIYDAQKETLKTLGLEHVQDNVPEVSRTHDRIQTNLDLAETYSDHRHNFQAFENVEEAVQATRQQVAQVLQEASQVNHQPEKTDLERLQEGIDKYLATLSQPAIAPREYEFKLTPGATLNDELRDWQQQIDKDLDHDVDQLGRRNERQEQGFLRLIAKLDEAIRDEEREQFEAHGQPDPDEAKGREEARGLFYLNAIKDFIHLQSETHQQNLDALYTKNEENVQMLNDTYAQHAPDLEGVVKALEEAQTSIQHIQPVRPPTLLPRKAASGNALDQLHELVLAGREHDPENER
jgi:hypothetical protein